MADKMMRIAGRTSGGTASPFLVEDGGEQVISRPWGIVFNSVLNAFEIRDTTAHTTIANGTVINLEQYPVNSLRIRSTLDADLKIQFYYDGNADQTVYLNKVSGTSEITIPADNDYWNIITPNDYDLLNYIKFLKLRLICSEAPTTGSVTIYHVGRK